MTFLAAIAVLLVLAVAGLSPYFVAGRYAIPAAERLALRELGADGVLTTIRRGADVFTPAQFRG